MAMKYIVCEYNGEERMYLFPSIEQHSEFAACLMAPPGDMWKPVRAGFVMYCDGVMRCSGESFSLGVVSDKQKDTAMLLKLLEP